MDDSFWLTTSLCFGVLLYRYEWERQLPTAVRRELVPTQRGAAQDMSLLREHGPFRNFPHFNTANPSLDKRCVNLLGQLSAWVLHQHAEQLQAALSNNDAV